MYTLNKKNTTFIIFFICLHLFSFLILIYSSYQKQLNELSNGLYTNHYVVFNDNNPQKYIENLNRNVNFRLFIEYNDVFRFFIQKNEEWKPPMQKGRFFLHNENSPKAVVGKGLVNHIKKHKGLDYITFEGKQYEVIGIMGASFVSRADYIILLNSKEIPITDGMKIIIDSDSKSPVNKIVENITKKYKTISYVDGTLRGLSKTDHTNFFYYLLVIDSLLLIICSMFMCLRYWYETEKNIIHVKFLFGISQNIIIIECLKKVSLNILISNLIVNMGDGNDSCKNNLQSVSKTH